MVMMSYGVAVQTDVFCCSRGVMGYGCAEVVLVVIVWYGVSDVAGCRVYVETWYRFKLCDVLVVLFRVVGVAWCLG